MCYAIPGRIVELKANIAVVDYFGERRNVLNEFSGIKIGDYVYAQGGVLIQKVSSEEAIPILDYWKDKFFQLAQTDLSTPAVSGVSRMHAKSINPGFKKAVHHVILSGRGALPGALNRKNRKGILGYKLAALSLLRATNKNELGLLFETANAIRQEKLKNACCVHGIIEFSNNCRNNCSYCGIRHGNKNLKRYRMTVDEIIQLAGYGVNKLGFKALVLQSGEDTSYTTKDLVRIIKGIKQRCGVLLFMSIGQRSKHCYKRMYEAGAKGVLLRFETSNPVLYKKLHSGSDPKSNFKERIELIKYAKKLGYIIATGALIGIPGQSNKDILNDILLAKSLNSDMYSFGPFIPAPATPLEKEKPPALNKALQVIALSRLLCPDAKILVTTALEVLDKENGRKQGLLAGANSLMINITPAQHSKNYALYPGKPHTEVSKHIKQTIDLLYSLGRAPTDLWEAK